MLTSFGGRLDEGRGIQDDHCVSAYETVIEAVSVDEITRETLGSEKRRRLGQSPEEPSNLMAR